MRRLFWWYLLAPQLYLLAGLWRDAGLPPIDVSVLLCMFLAMFAERQSLPWLLLGAAAGRAMVDEAGLPVQILVLGVPVAVLLPFRTLLFGQRWAWQAAAAAGGAIAVPKLAGWFGAWFGQPSQSAGFDWLSVVTAALLLPPMLFALRLLPPLALFEERP